jgi:hypothetical protein
VSLVHIPSHSHPSKYFRINTRGAPPAVTYSGGAPADILLSFSLMKSIVFGVYTSPRTICHNIIDSYYRLKNHVRSREECSNF